MTNKAILISGAVSAFFVAACVNAQITVDGTLDSAFGSPLAVQTINTGFGDSTVGDGTSTGGSELDAAYGAIQNGNLYLFLAGNVEDNGNHLNVFISDGAPGQSSLSLPATATMQAMNGSVFSPGFQANLALDLNDYQGTTYVEEYQNLGGTPTGGYVGDIPLTGGIGTGSPGGSILYGWNDVNAAGVNGNGGTAADQTAAAAVTTGVEIEVPLSLLGNTTGPIEVLADINGGGDDYLSDQFLAGLPVGTGNLGNGGVFNFGSTPGEYFTVTPSAPDSASTFELLLVGAGAMGVCRRCMAGLFARR
jgi:hypothetical protein